MDEDVLKRIQRIVSEAMAERRCLVIFSALRPQEIDRMARRVERDTLDKIETLLGREVPDMRTSGLRRCLDRMREELRELGEQGTIRDTSRQMQNEEIIWQTFEDIAGLLDVR